MPADGPVLAIDVGGTKFAAGVVDVDGTVLAKDERPTPQADAQGLWDALLGLVTDVLGGRAVAGVGIGCGGPMDWARGAVSPLNIPGWRGFPLRDRVAARFPDLPVRLHNDAVCFAVAEHWRGAATGAGSCLGMVVSTGVGGGLVLEGRVAGGPTGNAGHVGHVVVDPHGPPCACGGFGCLEAVASGPSLTRWALQEGWRAPGERASARDVVAAAGAGHPVALAALTRAGQAVGVALASMTALLDLDVVVVGGGVAAAGPLLFDAVQVAFRRHARLDYTRRAEVRPSALGRDAGVVGAAALVLAGDRYWGTR